MITYPNQKVIHINKQQYVKEFLQVGILEWQEAYKVLSPTAFAIYLYLAGNMNGFNLALSQKAIEDTLGIKKSSYHLAIKQLNQLGFIVPIQGNIEAFNTTPPVQKIGQTQVNDTEIVQEIGQECPKKWTEQSKKMDIGVQKNDREIDIIDNTYNIDKSAQLNDSDNKIGQEKKEEGKAEEEVSGIEIKPEQVKPIVLYLEKNKPEAYEEYLRRTKYVDSKSGTQVKIDALTLISQKYNLALTAV